MTPKARSSERLKRKRGNEMSENKSAASAPSETEDCVAKHRKAEIEVDEYVGRQVGNMAQSRKRDAISVGNSSEAGQGSGSQFQTSEVKDEDGQPPTTEFKKHQPRENSQYPLGAAQEGSDQRSWKEKYDELLECSIKERESYVEELKDLRNSLTDAEKRVEEIKEERFEEDRLLFRRALYSDILPSKLDQRYRDIYHEISSVCRKLANKVTISTAAAASRDAEYWDIANSGRENRVKKLLDVGTPQVQRDILACMVLNYILRQVFGPMLVGLDRESEALLQGLQKNLESRMIRSGADKWISDLLHGYKLLPFYQADREHFLSPHSKKLRGFFEYLDMDYKQTLEQERRELTAENREKVLYPDHAFQFIDWEDISKHFDEIIEEAANLAADMSFSWVRFLVDWDYCEEKKEITKQELDTHELHLVTGQPVSTEHFPHIGEDEKVADVLMVVCPPILGMREGSREIWGKPVILVEPVPGFVANPPRRRTFLDFLEEKEKRKEERGKKKASEALEPSSSNS